MSVCIRMSRVPQEKMGIQVYQDLWERRYSMIIQMDFALAWELRGRYQSHIDYPLLRLGNADIHRKESTAKPTRQFARQSS